MRDFLMLVSVLFVLVAQIIGVISLFYFSHWTFFAQLAAGTILGGAALFIAILVVVRATKRYLNECKER